MFLFPNSSPFFIKIGLTSTYQILVISAVAASVSYRVVNTLDAMVGYKDSTNINIGWFPAKLDDVLNFIPARITSMLIVLAAFILSFDYEQSWKIILKDANLTPSPNSGYPMAAAAGALNVQLNKPGTYKLGESKKCLTINEIKLAIKLSFVTIILFLVGISLFFIIFAYW
jgi:adenosylcobinamide-phosphate synthase